MTGSGLQIILVGGLSGAGKTSVLHVFEDLGFFCIDGLPVRAISSIVQLFCAEKIFRYKGLAFGMNALESDFLSVWSGLREEFKNQRIRSQLLFLEASNEVLLRRYATTRRPHPLETQEGGLEKALVHERKTLAPVREQADLVIDSSQYSVHDLRRIVQKKWEFLEKNAYGMRLYFITFGFKYGVPAEADMVFDLRFLPNPYFDENLRSLSGQDEKVAEYVLKNEQGAEFYSRFLAFLQYIIPQYAGEGRYRLTVAIGCTGGRHRSVAVSEALFHHFQKTGYEVSLEHRHLALG